MTCTIDTESTRRLSAKFAAGLAISAFLALVMCAAPASAAGHHGGGHRGGEHHYGGRGYGNRGGGYYPAPPVVYGSPYGSPYGYAPPPVVYGSGINIMTPGISLGIR